MKQKSYLRQCRRCNKLYNADGRNSRVCQNCYKNPQLNKYKEVK